MDFKNKNMELFIEDFSTTEDIDTGVITISGYANRYKDAEGQLVVDRSQESVLPSGYDIASFKKNPILLYQHKKDEPIGKIIALELRPDGFYIEASVHRALHEKAYYAIQHGILRMFSIGFLVKNYEELDGIYYWTEIEILEVSAVSVGDNQESLFNVMRNSPCNNGTCMLSSKATGASNKEEIKEWSSVDKGALLKTIEKHGTDDVVEEAYLIVKDVEDHTTWKFPHHDFGMEGLTLLDGGLKSAFSGLKGAKDDSVHSNEDKLKASEHLIRHYSELLESGSVDNIPDDLLELKTYFEEKIVAEQKDGGEGTPAEGEASSGQPDGDETINTSTQPEEGGNNPQNPEPAGDGASNEPDGEKVTSIEDVNSFIEEAKKSPEGLETLFNLYAGLEASINEALPKLLEENQ